MLRQLSPRHCVLVCGVLLVSTGLLLLAMWTKATFSIRYELLFRDIGAMDDLPVSAGLFSQLGIIIWSVGIGALLLTLLSGQTFARNFRPVVAYSLLLTVLLAADDTFRIHETVFAEVLGWGESTAFLIYGLLLLGYFGLFLMELLATPLLLLGVALSLFALSVAVDQTPGLANYIGYDNLFLLEDGAKLSGIVCWTCYQLLLSRICVLPRRDFEYS